MTIPNTTETTAGKPSYGDTSVRDLNEALRELHEVTPLDVHRPPTAAVATVFSVPSGRRLESIKKYLDEYLPKPERRGGTSTTFAIASFIDMVKRFGATASAVFADPDVTKAPANRTPSFTAVFDYTPANGPEGATLATDWLRHRSIYRPLLSDEWKVWMGGNGKAMGQDEFAHFLEDHAINLIVPNLDDPNLKTFAALVQGKFAEPTDLIQLSRSLEISIGTKAKQAVKLQSGEISITWDETHSDGSGAPIKIADLFQIQIPVFYAGEFYRLAARLRYRFVQAQLSFSYEIVQPEIAFKAAFDEMVEKVEHETTVPVFLGVPESAA